MQKILKKLSKINLTTLFQKMNNIKSRSPFIKIKKNRKNQRIKKLHNKMKKKNHNNNRNIFPTFFWINLPLDYAFQQNSKVIRLSIDYLCIRPYILTHANCTLPNAFCDVLNSL